MRASMVWLRLKRGDKSLREGVGSTRHGKNCRQGGRGVLNVRYGHIGENSRGRESPKVLLAGAIKRKQAFGGQK